MFKVHLSPRLAAGLLAVTLGLTVSAAAQNAPSQPASGDQAQGQEQPLETLKVNVDVVQLFFNVKDKHGALIPSLTKTDFDVFEDLSLIHI